jgi:hypothetical protein
VIRSKPGLEITFQVGMASRLNAFDGCWFDVDVRCDQDKPRQGQRVSGRVQERNRRTIGMAKKPGPIDAQSREDLG